MGGRQFHKPTGGKVRTQVIPVPVSAPIEKPAWYQSTLLWGAGSLGVGIVLTVVAAMKHDIRWLLWIAVLFFVAAAWEIWGYWTYVLAKRLLATVVTGCVIAAMLTWLYIALRPTNVEANRNDDEIRVTTAQPPVPTFNAYALRNANPRAGTDVDGIVWDDHFTELRVAVTNLDQVKDINGLDVNIQPDSWTHEARIIDRPSFCDLTRIAGPLVSVGNNKNCKCKGQMKITANRTGDSFEFQDNHANTYRILASQNGYRLMCSKLPSSFTVKIVFSLVSLPDSITTELGKPPEDPKNWKLGAMDFGKIRNIFTLLNPRPWPTKLMISTKDYGYLVAVKDGN